MPRDRQAAASPAASPLSVDQPHPVADAVEARFATTIAHLGLAADAAVDAAREARFQAAQQERHASRGNPLQRLMARLRPWR